MQYPKLIEIENFLAKRPRTSTRVFLAEPSRIKIILASDAEKFQKPIRLGTNLFRRRKVSAKGDTIVANHGVMILARAVSPGA